MSEYWFPTDKKTRDLLIKRFRDLIIGVITQIDPNNGKQGNINKKAYQEK